MIKIYKEETYNPTLVPHRVSYYPVGEMCVEIEDRIPFSSFVSIVWEFEKMDEIFELLLICDHLKTIVNNSNQIILNIPYFPFAREDRATMTHGYSRCFTLKLMAQLINSINANTVYVEDPHSDVLPALINRVNVKEQHEVFKNYFTTNKTGFLISPDGGALKKIYKLARIVKLPVIECSKQRDVATGEITGTTVHHDDFRGADCYIVDDICDGGRTFIEIAKVLKSKNAGKIILMVTHGFFTKGLEVFDGLIDEIYTRKGQIK